MRRKFEIKTQFFSNFVCVQVGSVFTEIHKPLFQNITYSIKKFWDSHVYYKYMLLKTMYHFKNNRCIIKIYLHCF